MKKSFPCPICKGKGSWIEPVTDEGQGPMEHCGYCDSFGIIEIGGLIHRRIVSEKLALEIIKFAKPKKELWEVWELQELGNRALGLVDL
jgi:hypothetical protein